MLAPLACVAALTFARPAASAERAHAPAFRVTTVEGRRLDSAALLAKGPVLLDFWATWCKPCIVSLPGLERLHEKYAARGLQTLAISIDGPRNFARVRPFAGKLGLRMPVVLDEDGSLQQRFQVAAVPTRVLIASDGTVVRVQTGYVPGEEDALERDVQTLLGAAAADSVR